MRVLRSGLTTVGKVVDLLSTAGGILCAVAVIGISLLVFGEVVARGVFKSPTTWSFEMAQFMIVAVGCLGSAQVLKAGAHIVVDILTAKLVERTRDVLEIFNTFLVVVFVVILSWYGLKMMIMSISMHEVSMSVMAYPMWIAKSFVPIGAFLVVLQGVRILIQKIRLLQGHSKPADPSARGLSLQNPAVLMPLYIAAIIGLAALFTVNPSLALPLMTVLLLFAGVPVAFALGLTGSIAIFLALGGERGMAQTAQINFLTLENFILGAIPMFILAGAILGVGGVARQLYALAYKWLGQLPGGLAIATMAACGLFSSISGSTIATAASMGSIAIPEMIGRNYERKLAYGTVAAGGCLGTMIPPSLSFIVYGMMTGVSVGQLFIAGILPGVLMTVSMCTLIYFLCRGKPRYKSSTAFSWKEGIFAFKDSAWGLLCPVLILGGIYSGLATPTEAASVAVVYGLVVGIFITRTIKGKEFKTVLFEGTRSASMLLFIIVGAYILGRVVTQLRIPQMLIEAIVSAHVAPWVFIGAVMMVVLALGTVLEAGSILLIVTPLAFPVVMALGLNPIWFGVVLNLNLEIGMITPPVGMTMFTVKSIAPDSDMGEIYRGSAPFVGVLLLVLVVLLFVPQIALFLPSHMTMK